MKKEGRKTHRKMCKKKEDEDAAFTLSFFRPILLPLVNNILPAAALQLQR